MPRDGHSTLSLERYAPEAKALVAGAQALADERKHAEVQPLHLLARTLERERGVRAVLDRAGVNTIELAAAAERSLAALPHSSDPAYLADSMLDLLERAGREAERERSESVRLEHVMNALTQEIRGPAGELFGAYGIAPGSLRRELGALGGQRGLHAQSKDRAAAAPPTGDDVTRDLVELAKRSGEVVGRTAEVNRLLAILERRTKSHPLLVGEPGVGKRAVVLALAQRVLSGNVPASLASARLHDVDTGALVAGARLRGEIEERVRRLLAEHARRDSILVFHAVDQLFAQGPAGSALGDLLRAALLRGEPRMLGTTTPDGLKRIQERDVLVLHSFTVLPIAEPSETEAIDIVRGSVPGYAAHHSVEIADAAVIASVRLAKRYVEDRFLPDSALDLLDEAAAARRVTTGARDAAAPVPVLGEEDVANTLSLWTGIPVAKMLEGEAARLMALETRLGDRVVGQDQAVGAVARAVRRGRVGLRDAKRPIGSFLFLGPSGVGKTELAKTLADVVFADERALTRLDMSEFMERHMAQRLLGAPPGYADSEQGGFLTEAVRRRPYSVLLFDEVEKAHADVFNLLLQLLDEGRLTDGRGRTADFSNTIVIMTSNIGSDRILETDEKLFESEEGRESLKNVLLEKLRSFFRPELLNRIDETVVFRPLTRPNLLRIVDLELGALSRLLAEKRIGLVADDAARAQLVELGYDPALGARPLKRAILKHVQDPLAEGLVAGRHAAGSTVNVRAAGGRIVIE
ncbi:MAG TPA: ATP-dependent Clp protease ATP-binding subunit [Polyangiaceae bacterium]